MSQNANTRLTLAIKTRKSVRNLIRVKGRGHSSSNLETSLPSPHLDLSQDEVGEEQTLPTLEVKTSYVAVGATEDRNNPIGKSLQSLRFRHMFTAPSSPLPFCQ